MAKKRKKKKRAKENNNLKWIMIVSGFLIALTISEVLGLCLIWTGGVLELYNRVAVARNNKSISETVLNITLFLALLYLVDEIIKRLHYGLIPM